MRRDAGCSGYTSYRSGAGAILTWRHANSGAMLTRSFCTAKAEHEHASLHKRRIQVESKCYLSNAWQRVERLTSESCTAIRNAACSCYANAAHRLRVSMAPTSTPTPTFTPTSKMKRKALTAYALVRRKTVISGRAQKRALSVWPRPRLIYIFRCEPRS